MAAFSDFLETELLDYMFGLGTYTGAVNNTTKYSTVLAVGLFTADPTDAWTNHKEYNNGSALNGYARQNHGNGATTWARSTNTVDNANADIQFSTATAIWGTITHVGIMTATVGSQASTTELLYHGALNTQKSVASGDVFKFAAGDLNIAHE